MSWVGETDLKAAEEGRVGPVEGVLTDGSFDAAVLLSNYAKWREETYRRRLTARDMPRVHIRHEGLGGDPTDYVAIHNAVVGAQGFVREEFGDDVDMAIHVSSGTPAMHAIWVLLAKTRYPAELIQSSRERGVSTISVPFDIAAEFVPSVLRKTDKKLERISQGLPPETPEFSDILGQSPAINLAKNRARRAAPHSYPVVIEGESGTGKELFARAIHAASPRTDGTFVEVNCGALPADLAESILFGHEKEAFTGATERHHGHFEEANGGTIFLDELGELPLNVQAKLLRTLQEGTVQRMGSSETTPIDVRVVAATNRDLANRVAQGEFRGDLYHRLAVLVIKLPALRERVGDLGLLIDHLLGDVHAQLSDQPGFMPKNLTPGARNLLLNQPWPGNVRQLHNMLVRLAVWSEGELIDKATCTGSGFLDKSAA